MARPTTRRVLFVLTASIGLLVLAAAPAGAFYEQSNSGSYGDYTFFNEFDQGGVRCLYENNPGTGDDELDKVRARQFQSHGPFANDSKIVSWFQLQRNTLPHNDNVYTTVARSPAETGFADDEFVDYFGPYTFTVPENTTSRWRIRVLINYYNVAGTHIVGRVRGIIEVYEHTRAGSMTTYDVGQYDDMDQYDGYCRKEFYPIPIM